MQYGGPDGELGASLRYLSQRFAMPYSELKGILTDIGRSVEEVPPKNNYSENSTECASKLRGSSVEVMLPPDKKYPDKPSYPSILLHTVREKEKVVRVFAG